MGVVFFWLSGRFIMNTKYAPLAIGLLLATSGTAIAGKPHSTPTPPAVTDRAPRETPVPPAATDRPRETPIPPAQTDRPRETPIPPAQTDRPRETPIPPAQTD
jgi:hypothetical protein